MSMAHSCNGLIPGVHKKLMFGQGIRFWHKPLRRLPMLQHRMVCAGEINQICISLMFDPMKTHHYWAGVHSGVFQW
jgi:hypothetical protein